MIQKILNKLGLVIYKINYHKMNYHSYSSFNPLEQLIIKNLNDDFFYIQIGANDGISFDPIYPILKGKPIYGIALEPVKDIFDELVENFKDRPNIKLLNLAIHKSKKKEIIYRVNPSIKNLPNWTKGIGSFNKDHYKLTSIDKEYIIEELVNCISWDELIENYNIEKIDLLQIDTEGYDLKIIESIEFDKIKPTIISFEHGLMENIMTFDQFSLCQKILMKEGYNLIILERDAIAYLKN